MKYIVKWIGFYVKLPYLIVEMQGLTLIQADWTNDRNEASRMTMMQIESIYGENYKDIKIIPVFEGLEHTRTKRSIDLNGLDRCNKRLSQHGVKNKKVYKTLRKMNLTHI
jgi:hypothetical protein